MVSFNSREEFVKYLNSLKIDKPFDCDYLRVLPENVCLRAFNPVRIYTRKDLLCMKSMEVQGENYHCGLTGNLKISEGGRRLETGCKWQNPLQRKLLIQVVGRTP